MNGSLKPINSLQYNMQFWMFVEKVTDLYHIMTPKQRLLNTVRKAMVSLENDDMDRAVEFYKKASSSAPECPEVLQLKDVIQWALGQKKDETLALVDQRLS
jgi:hypothetical protein